MALLAVRQAMCGERPTTDRPVPQDDADDVLPEDPLSPQDGLFHIALPRPLPERRESAPMNWVLNPAARRLLLTTGPEAGFNCRQARGLARLLNTLRGQPGAPLERCAGEGP